MGDAFLIQNIKSVFEIKIVTQGLVLHLDAGNTSSYPGSGTTWFDLSGNNRNATLVNNPTFSTNHFVLNGTNQYIPVGTISESNTSLVTITGFFRRGTSNTWNGALFGFGIADTSTQDIYFWGSESQKHFGFNTWDGDSWGYNNSTNAGEAMDGNWRHITAVFNRNNITQSKLYVDGVQKSLSQVRGSTLNRTISTNFGIGLNGWNTGNQLFNGSISTLQMYNRELTANEIQQNFNAEKSRFGL
jgi:hypothetical protein